MTQTTHINLDYLRLMTDGDADMEQTMLEMLLAELPEEFNLMKKLHSNANWSELHKVSHKMKSTLAFVGNDELTSANKHIELAAKDLTDLEKIEGWLNNMDACLPGVLEELQALSGK